MTPFNIEVFDPEFNFRSAFQTDSAGKYEYDYASISKSSVKIPKIEAYPGDYIRFTKPGAEECSGIITSVKKKKGQMDVVYKPFLKYLDVNIHIDKEQLADMTLEEWIADIIEEFYVNSADSEQNINGLVVTHTESVTNAVINIDKTIGNLYDDIIQQAMTSYNVVVDFAIDVARKRINCRVVKRNEPELVIEADLPNVLEAEFNIEKDDDNFNKVYVYNELDESQMMIYYRDTDGNITDNPDPQKRITPVVFSTMTVKFDEEKEAARTLKEGEEHETFEDKAYEKAFSKLKAEEYDNLIKIECLQDDKLIHPLELKIGQTYTILHAGYEYHAILTGKEINKTVTLMFGMVREELTKKLTRKFRKMASIEN